MRLQKYTVIASSHRYGYIQRNWNACKEEKCSGGVN